MFLLRSTSWVFTAVRVVGSAGGVENSSAVFTLTDFHVCAVNLFMFSTLIWFLACLVPGLLKPRNSAGLKQPLSTFIEKKSIYIYVCRKCNSISKTETLNNVPGSSRLMSAAVRNNDRAASHGSLSRLAAFCGLGWSDCWVPTSTLWYKSY